MGKDKVNFNDKINFNEMQARATGMKVSDAFAAQIAWGPRTDEVSHIYGKAAKIIAQCAKTDEPFFVLRAKDLLSLFALIEYLEQIEKLGPDDHEMQMGVVNIIAEFKAWQHAHRDQVRYPD